MIIKHSAPCKQSAELLQLPCSCCVSWLALIKCIILKVMCSYKVNSMWEQWSRLNSIHQGISNMVTTYLSETHCYYENAISKGNNIVSLYTALTPKLSWKNLKLKPNSFMHLNWHTKLLYNISQMFCFRTQCLQNKKILWSVVGSLVWQFNCLNRLGFRKVCILKVYLPFVFDVLKQWESYHYLMIRSALFLCHGC